ncbi:hypothetical protein PUR61_05420 [Streptomyces sp. BE20]|uniref:hypothetical protein n=1 Tax=Streptomyces sp. BE20 TaxID=3002525 RepID=UPI002E774DF0|nr:hypothetical protein [Streptomyces sp. BE20]MEE1821638.1 hypothetical protein [Streptomyces sp. BE20]
MLSVALRLTRQLAGIVADLTVPPGPAAAARESVTAAQDGLLPQIADERAGLQDFTARAAAEIAALNVGTPAPGAAADALHRLGQGFEEQKTLLAPLVDRINRFRDALAARSADMTRQQAELQSRLAALAAERTRLSSQRDELRTRTTITSIVGILIPLVKIADEIAGAVQYGETTEAAIGRADAQIARLNSEAQELGSVTVACTALGSALDQLAPALQNLANATALVGGHLTNDAARAAAATPTTLKLYLASLTTAMAVLGDSVG